MSFRLFAKTIASAASLALLALAGCKTDAPGSSSADAGSMRAAASANAGMSLAGTGADAAAQGSVSTPMQDADAGDAAMRGLVVAWSRALDAHDVSALSSLYAPRVRFYGRDVSRGAVVAQKARALGGGSTFHQQIVGDPSIMTGPDGAALASFVKRSGSAKMSDVKARLVAQAGDAGALQITEETDEPSIARAADKSREDCDALASATVNALPGVKKLLADIQKEIDAKYKDRALGGVGPIDDGDGGFTSGLGVQQPERYEALVWYTVTKLGDLSVMVMGQDTPIPAAQKSAVQKACKAAP